MASFQAKTGWERPRKSENKNYRSDLFLLDPELRIPKIMQKILKIKKRNNYGFFSSQNRTGEVENVRKKNSHSDPFQPDPEQGILEKQQKNSKN